MDYLRKSSMTGTSTSGLTTGSSNVSAPAGVRASSLAFTSTSDPLNTISLASLSNCA